MFIRRSPLIVLLSVELMLNSCNLALIAFSRQFGSSDGQVFALIVMADRRLRGRRRPRPGRGHVAAADAELDTDALTGLARADGDPVLALPASCRWPARSCWRWLYTRITREAAAWLGTAFAFASFLCAAAVFFQMLGEDESSPRATSSRSTPGRGRPRSTVPMACSIDQLSVIEMLIVSGIGSLIVMYSIGYMHGDPKERRFFAYLDLFLFSMLLLVMAGNFVLLLAGWGLVGLSSYLLIGFWHERRRRWTRPRRRS